MRGFEGQAQRINEHGVDILKEFCFDEEFLRYCKILNDNPLESEVDLNELQSDIFETRGRQGLIDLRMVPDRVETEGRVKIYFHPISGKPSKDEITSSELFFIGIIVPNEYDVLYGLGQWRDVNILKRIAHFIDDKPITGVGNCKITHWERNRILNSPDYSILVAYVEVISGKGYKKIFR